jgi:hypothetical protein
MAQWSLNEYFKDVEATKLWLKRTNKPLLSRIQTTRQGIMEFRSLPAFHDALLRYTHTLSLHINPSNPPTYADLLRLRYQGDGQVDFWFSLKEIFARGGDDCEGLGCLLAAWLWVVYGIRAIPSIAWFWTPGTTHQSQQKSILHCVTLVPDVPTLPAEIRVRCWTRYPLFYPIASPPGYLVADLSVDCGMVIPIRYAHLVGSGPDGSLLPAHIIQTPSGLTGER